MWLRLLDLFDISKKRVTHEVFHQYFNEMNAVSKFHWVKHFCTDDFDINISTKECDLKKSDSLEIEVKFLINFNSLPNPERLDFKLKDCNLYDDPQDKKNSGIYSRKERKCDKDYCNLQCAFLNEFFWLDNEIKYINQYSNIYNLSINLSVNYVNSNNESNFVNSSKFMYSHKNKNIAYEVIKNYIQYEKAKENKVD